MISCGTEACPCGPPVRALAHMPHEHQPWPCAVDHILTLKLLHTFHHGSMACTCQEAARAISQDARSVKHRDFCEKIAPSIPAVIDVQTMNEFTQKYHLVFQVAQLSPSIVALLVATTGLPWSRLPLLPPILYAHLAMKPCSTRCETHSAGTL